MNGELIKYFENGITIDKLPNGKYSIFTKKTQRFVIDSLEQLTPELFEEHIQKDLTPKPTTDTDTNTVNTIEKSEGIAGEYLTYDLFKNISDSQKTNTKVHNQRNKYRLTMNSGGSAEVYVHTVVFKSITKPDLNEVVFVIPEEDNTKFITLTIAQLKKNVKEFILIS